MQEGAPCRVAAGPRGRSFRSVNGTRTDEWACSKGLLGFHASTTLLRYAAAFATIRKETRELNYTRDQ
ncbi:hypothetical protein NDU88_001951 [Pleurodeles waltl]|uniref:Uncharacterized protein n=1 Tax=Pleurodeles waltl TaxID=8319 RepID=A0AAV7VD82_PLEWA|nr:hypothetical protein NDU88_001951 [Pleurodeles waltl]